ncbi:MAG: helix-turn-helix transcriptional regulator, partial [Nocardioidaceae bacterium]
IEAAVGEVAGSAAAVDIHIDPVDPQIRAAVDDALARARRMHIGYYVPGRDETTERDVDPLRLIFSEGTGYLEAYCHRARENRLFRLDRVTAAAVLDHRAEPPKDSSRRDLSQGMFHPDPDDPVAIVDLAPNARWVAEYYPVESQRELGDGRLQITLRFSDRQWLQRLILRLGGSARIVEPADLSDSVRSVAAEALANY